VEIRHCEITKVNQGPKIWINGFLFFSILTKTQIRKSKLWGTFDSIMQGSNPLKYGLMLLQSYILRIFEQKMKLMKYLIMLNKYWYYHNAQNLRVFSNFTNAMHLMHTSLKCETLGSTWWNILVRAFYVMCNACLRHEKIAFFHIKFIRMRLCLISEFNLNSSFCGKSSQCM